MENTIDDAKFDEILKQSGAQPIASGADPWADFGGPVASTPSFMDTVKNRATAVVENPGEATKGFLKGGIKTAVDLGVKLPQAIGKALLPDIGGLHAQGLDTTAVDELTTPTNEAQKGGGNIETGVEFLGSGIKSIPSMVKGGLNYVEKRGVAKASNFIKDLITPELNKTASINAIKTGKVTEGGILKDRDITGAVPFFEDTAKAVSEVPGISKSKTLLENANSIHDHIGTVADDLVSQLKVYSKDMKISNLAQVPEKFNQYMQGVKATLKENPTLVGDAEKTATKILDKFESLVKAEGSTPDAILSARKKLDTWMSSQKGDNIFDPKTEGAVSVALRAIRQGGNDFISSLAKDVNGKEIVKVKDMLAKQTSLYNAIENIAPKAAKEGASGFKRWVKAHPTLINTAKNAGLVGLGAVGLGGVSKIVGQ